MADAPPPKAAYSRGNKLRLCAPAHTGLPMNASAVVAACRFTAEGWRYDVTLTGGGSSGSDVRFVKDIGESWLRDENHIATAKECAARPWGQWVRAAPRLLVPIFQRRYCWGPKQQHRLWRDVVSPPSLGLGHGLGRVIVQRSAAKPQD